MGRGWEKCCKVFGWNWLLKCDQLKSWSIRSMRCMSNEAEMYNRVNLWFHWCSFTLRRCCSNYHHEEPSTSSLVDCGARATKPVMWIITLGKSANVYFLRRIGMQRWFYNATHTKMYVCNRLYTRDEFCTFASISCPEEWTEIAGLLLHLKPPKHLLTCQAEDSKLYTKYACWFQYQENE